MVLEEVGVLIEVDRLKGELAKTLATVCVRCGVRCNTTATELGSCAVLKERDQIKPKKVDIHATHAYLVIHLEIASTEIRELREWPKWVMRNDKL
jgi:hypothetical protein